MHPARFSINVGQTLHTKSGKDVISSYIASIIPGIRIKCSLLGQYIFRNRTEEKRSNQNKNEVHRRTVKHENTPSTNKFTKRVLRILERNKTYNRISKLESSYRL